MGTPYHGVPKAVTQLGDPVDAYGGEDRVADTHQGKADFACHRLLVRLLIRARGRNQDGPFPEDGEQSLESEGARRGLLWFSPSNSKSEGKPSRYQICKYSTLTM